MANEIAKWTFISILSFIVMKPTLLIQGQQQVPCLYFFGDSQFDNGNNNNLRTEAKANYQPYGIDFPSGPTGRFTNGPNIADYIAQFLGFESPIPPFATANGTAIVNGLNYASGGAGILPESGSQMGDRIPLDGQLLNHASTMFKLMFLLKNQSVDKYLHKCLYIFNMGSNDYINNYFLPGNLTRFFFTPERFAQHLIQRYSRQLRTLYNLGARKVAVFGLGLIGCTPQELGLYPASVNASGCVDSINGAVVLFNNKLRSLVDQFNGGVLAGANFTYIDSFAISAGDPSAIGITVVNAPCCVVSKQTGQCARDTTPCINRNAYAFWDNFHPTSILNLVTATMAYNASSPSVVHPVDIRTLASI